MKNQPKSDLKLIMKITEQCIMKLNAEFKYSVIYEQILLEKSCNSYSHGCTVQCNHVLLGTEFVLLSIGNY